MWCRSSAWTRRRARGGWPAARPIQLRSVSLKRLRIAGGQPARPRFDIPSEIAERPRAVSPDFTYRPSGDIIARSGARRRGGHADLTAYSQIRFPLAKTPAIVRSQSFGKHKSGERPRTYPWRDNFCEDRSFQVGQCAAGFGHQGQDIRPAPCPPNGESESHLPSKEAGRRRRPRRRPDPLTEAAGGHAADQHTQRAHPLSLHAHEPVQHGRRRHS